MELKKVLLIYNPNSGNGLFKNNLDRILEMFQNRRMLVIPVRTDDPDYLDTILREVQKYQFSKIIAAGGDGTINVVVNAMLNNGIDLPLAIFPAGTANDFAYYFDIPHDIEGMVEIALGENYTWTDVGKINDRYFINVAAMGFLVDVSQKTDPEMKNTLGVMSYYIKGLSEVPKLQPISVTIESAEHSATEHMYFMLVMNGKSAGGFKRIGAHAEINDGFLDVILFREMPVTELPGLLVNFIQGQHTENKNVLYFKTKWMRVESDSKIGTDIDGEKGDDFPLEIQCLQKKIKINTLRSEMEGSKW
jgi:YegS/Rv2252/BmrU family lipid kinase